MKTTKDKSRLYGAKIYFVLSILIFGAIFLIWKWNYFTDAPLPGFRNWRRILWCISWSFLGFSAIAHKSSKKNHTGSAWPSYATVYPLALVFISMIVFSVLHIFEGTKNYLFYFLSTPICFVFSYSIDQLIEKKFAYLKELFNNLS
jgi:hypothetical protein